MQTYPETQIDGYKVDHRRQYPNGTEIINSNLTARGTRRQDTQEVVFFGLQYFIKEYLINQWNKNFFSQPKEKVVQRFERRINNYLGPNNVGTKHIEELHDLGYLPISIYALPEGSLYKLRVPCLSIFNTLPNFFWVTNYLETILSTTVWGPCTSATTAFQYKKLLSKFALETVGSTDFVPFQGHDFSFRGMFGMEAAVMSGGAHLTSFCGTDTIPAIDWLEEFYNADVEKEMVGVSVAATEHSVACSTILNFVDKVRVENNGKIVEDELMNLADVEYVKYLITEIYPTGIVSIVADSFDYWNTITNTARVLKDVIMARDGKVVFRPDTGDPVKVVCGYNYINVCLNDDSDLHYYDLKETGFPKVIYSTTDCKYYFTNIIHDEYENTEFNLEEVSEAEIKGSIECLWDIFGGTISEQGYKILDSHVGLIYGDSITLQRANEICQQLKDKKFASINIVFGIGSFTYQYVTRDTDAYAVKATFARVNGKDINIYKKPKTGDGTKNSALGLVAVFKDENGEFYLKDQATWEEVKNCELKEVFTNGKLLIDQTLGEVRERINSYL
jgi:nicotinamide phosphoribosyltransferase